MTIEDYEAICAEAAHVEAVAFDALYRGDRATYGAFYARAPGLYWRKRVAWAALHGGADAAPVTGHATAAMRRAA